MNHLFVAAVCASLAASCAVAPESRSAAPQELRDQLAASLALEGPAQDSAMALLDAAPGEIESLLNAIALDSSLATPVRASALRQLGARHVPAFETFERTIGDPDPRVRAATLGAAGRVYDRAPERSLSLIARGLDDEDSRVQAKALQELGDRDVPLLRRYVERGPPEALAPVALQLLQLAEENGARLVPDSQGRLERTAPSGVRLRWTPRSAVDDAVSGMGTLEVLRANGAVELGDSVRVKRAVVPAAVSSRGRYIAFEEAGTIRVRDLVTGAEHVVGTGIAPRGFPLTDSFLFFRRETDPVQSPTGTTLEYRMLVAPFSGGEALRLSRVQVPGPAAASPLRWARMVEDDPFYSLLVDGLRVPIPSPITLNTPEVPD